VVIIRGTGRLIVMLCFTAVCFSLPKYIFGQELNKVIIANLKQDLELVNREVTSLRSEVEMLRRENAQIRVIVEQLDRLAEQTKGSEASVRLNFQTRVQALELALKESEKIRSSMQKELNRKFEQIIEQMNRGFEQVSSTVNGSPVAAQPSFSDNYPKNGFVHKVDKGETVSSIAQKYKSKVSWIINANQIADPTKVFVGRELFVPQK